MLRACIDCGALSDQSRCPRHRANATGERGSTRQWRKVRAKVLKRDRYTCAYCGQRATTVDHVIAKRDGGTEDESNLVAACTGCNYGKDNN